MRILILGGTGFLGPHLVDLALARNWEVTTFNRGKTDPKRLSGERYRSVRQLRGNRDPGKDDGLKSLESLVAELKSRGERLDAVIDNSAYVPRIAKASAELLSPVTQMYQFVSTVSVYTDQSVPPDESTPVGTIPDPTIEQVNGETYGPLKALCEQAVATACPGSTSIVRPGRIVGPGDDSCRFTYWPVRIAKGGRVLAPRAARPDDAHVQIIDVRDLAAFQLKLVEDGHNGTFIAAGPEGPLTMAEMLAGVKATVSAPVEFEWIDESWLLGEGVQPWMGLPLWIPQSPETSGSGRARNGKALAHGLSCRPLADTARDTIADFEATKDERPADFAWGTGRAPGISVERESELLKAWDARQR